MQELLLCAARPRTGTVGVWDQRVADAISGAHCYNVQSEGQTLACTLPTAVVPIGGRARCRQLQSLTSHMDKGLSTHAGENNEPHWRSRNDCGEMGYIVISG